MEGISNNQEQLHQLVEQAKEGSEQAWCLLMRWFRPLQERLLRKVHPAQRDECRSESRFAFLQAVCSYNPDRGTSVTTWVVKQAVFRVRNWEREQRRKQSPLTSDENRCIPALLEAMRQIQQEQQVEHPDEQAIIARYREIKGATPDDEHLLYTLRWMRRGGENGQFADLEDVQLQAEGMGARQMERQADRANEYCMVRRALGEKMAVTYLVQQVLEMVLDAGAGPDWKTLQRLAQEEAFQVEGFSSWNAVHAYFGLPAWVPMRWAKARQTLLKNGVPLTARAYRARRMRGQVLLEAYQKRHGLG